MNEPSRPGGPARPGVALLGAGLITLPGVLIRLMGIHPVHWLAAACFGLAVVGAAFMLAWAAEAVQVDISAGLALALLALVAVLPEYAVDFVFTWKAGKHPAEFAPDALANMTGGNQLLIGAGWSLVVLVAAYRIRPGRTGAAPTWRDDRPRTGSTDVELERSNTSRSRSSVDRDHLRTHACRCTARSRCSTRSSSSSIFVVYMVRVAGHPRRHRISSVRRCTIGTLPTASAPRRRRRCSSARSSRILVCAEPFAESLVDDGPQVRDRRLRARSRWSHRSRPKRPSCSSRACSRGGSTPTRGSARSCRRR